MSFSLKIAVVITTSNVLLLCLSNLPDLKNETNIKSMVDLINVLYTLLFFKNSIFSSENRVNPDQLAPELIRIHAVFHPHETILKNIFVFGAPTHQFLFG